MSGGANYYRNHPEQKWKKRESDKRYYAQHSDEIKSYHIRYNSEHKEEIKDKRHQSYLEHRDERLSKIREYRQKHPEKIRALWNKWEAEHPERMKESKEIRDNDPVKKELKKQKDHEYYLANRDKIVKRACDWWAKQTPKQRKEHNKLVMDRYHRDSSKVRLRERIKDSYKRAGGNFTKEEWLDILDKYDYRCAYCGSRENITIDHAIPLSKGGLNVKENIVPACHACNSRKNDRMPDEFKKACAKWLANRHYQEVMKLEFN